MEFKEWVFLTENQTVSQWIKQRVPEAKQYRQEIAQYLSQKIHADNRTEVYAKASEQQKRAIENNIIYRYSQRFNNNPHYTITNFIYSMQPSEWRYISHLAGSSGSLNSTDYDYIDGYKQFSKKDKISQLGKQNSSLFADAGGGWKWMLINQAVCPIEAEVMGHCGNNYGATDDRILSLRDPKGAAHLTFILKRDNTLGEMKGKYNRKPDSSYHPAIVALLKSPEIKGVRGGGDEHQNNFAFSDLSEEMQQDVLSAKPDMIGTRKPIASDDDVGYDYEYDIDQIKFDPSFVGKRATFGAQMPDGQKVKITGTFYKPVKWNTLHFMPDDVDLAKKAWEGKKSFRQSGSLETKGDRFKRR